MGLRISIIHMRLCGSLFFSSIFWVSSVLGPSPHHGFPFSSLTNLEAESHYQTLLTTDRLSWRPLGDTQQCFGAKNVAQPFMGWVHGGA